MPRDALQRARGARAGRARERPGATGSATAPARASSRRWPTCGWPRTRTATPRHNRDSCLLPIRGSGVHQQREGADGARSQVLNEVLASGPGEPARALAAEHRAHDARHLPGRRARAAARSRRRPSRRSYPLPRFDNVAREAGLDLYGARRRRRARGLRRRRPPRPRVGRRWASPTRCASSATAGDGTFEDRTAEAGPHGRDGRAQPGPGRLRQRRPRRTSWCCAAAGWDARAASRSRCCATTATARSRDVTKAAGLLRFAPTQTAALLDYDGDGWLDLFVGNESPGPRLRDRDARPIRPCELFHNNGDGTFTEVARRGRASRSSAS